MTTIADPKIGVTWRTACLAAADIIRRRGHCSTGAYGGPPNWAPCVVVALAEACNWNNRPLHDAFQAIIRQIGGESPVVWNERQNAASVIELLERVALS